MIKIQETKQEIIRKCLNNKFDIEIFKNFLKKILKIEYKNIEFSNEIDIKKYKNIEKADIIAENTDLNNKKIYIIIVKLKEKNKKIENFIGEIIKKFNIYGAITVFYTEKDFNWEFCFIKKIEFFNEIENDLFYERKVFYTFGENQKNYYAEKQFINLKIKKNMEIEKIENIFQIEKLKIDFFNEYKKEYIKLIDYIEKNIEIEKGKINDKFKSIKISKKIMQETAILFLMQEKNELNKKIYEKIQNYGIKIEDIEKIFQNNKNIIDFFEKFKFNKKENKFFEIEMAIDSEMIGKVFENFLETNERKTKGTFYTPKEIVYCMCKDALLQYLKNEMEDLTEKDLKKLIYAGEFLKKYDLNILNEKIKNDEIIKIEKFKMPLKIIENIDKIDELLKNIKIADPSSGSGAFLIEMLNEIANIRDVITDYIFINETVKQIIKYDLKKLNEKKENLKKIRSLYNLKSEIIKNCIYGVDIDKESVEICKYRLWISLISEKDDINNMEIENFYNMKFNIVEGNSLIENKSPIFSWEKNFCDVFNKKGGFDIIIGNPPYVGEKGNKDMFNELAKSEIGKRFYMGKCDLFYFFFHLGLDILKEKGILSFITTNYYITADGAFNLRKDFKERSNILKLINFNEVNIFNSARGQSNLITVLEKSNIKNKKADTIIFNPNQSIKLEEIIEIFTENYNNIKNYNINQNDLYTGDNLYIKLEIDKLDSILDKLIEENTFVKDYFNVNQGIVSGADKVTDRHIEKFNIKSEKGNGIFVIEKSENINIEKELMWDFYKNSDIEKYICNEKTRKYIIYTDKNMNIEDYPLAKQHLIQFKSVLENKRETKKGLLPWYSLNWGREKKIFISEKIVAPQRSLYNSFAYNDKEWFSSADVYYITKKNENIDLNLKYILALLNSKLYYLWLYKRGKRKGEMLELYSTPLENIPIKVIKKEEQEKFIEKINCIIEMKRNNKNTLKQEKEIDEMLYSLYNLTEDEKEIIESY